MPVRAVGETTVTAAHRIRRWHPLAREIAAVLLLKMLALGALWFFFFGPENRLNPTPDEVGTALFGPPPAAQTRSDSDV
jgi:hypothetical protein